MKFKKYLSMLLAAMMLLAALTGCGTGNDTPTSANSDSPGNVSAEVNGVDAPDETETPDVPAGYEPVTIENFDRTVEFTEKPQKVVVLTLNSAEMIAALGEAETITAIAHGNNTVEDILPEYYDMLKDCNFPEEINNGIPTLEGMLSVEPQLVVCNSYYFNVPDTFGTMDDYQANGVEFYITEGSYVANCTIENTYNDIRNLGAIFGKQAEAEAVISDMQQRISAIEEKVSGHEPVSVMTLNNISDDNYSVAGGAGLLQNLMELAGGKNIFDDTESQYPRINIEEIIARNPQVIVVLAYTYEGEEEAQSKVDALMNTEELSEVPAIKNNNIIIVPWFQGSPSLQNVDFIENLAVAMYPELFN